MASGRRIVAIRLDSGRLTAPGRQTPERDALEEYLTARARAGPSATRQWHDMTVARRMAGGAGQPRRRRATGRYPAQHEDRSVGEPRARAGAAPAAARPARMPRVRVARD